MTARSLLLLALTACVHLDERQGNPSGECGACDTPPPPSCTTPCRLTAYEPTGTCQDGACVYRELVTSCFLGCEDAACLGFGAPSAACAGATCGEPGTCGGVCTPGSGCCQEPTYQKTTGPTSSGTMVCCDGADARLSAVDCGDGQNHSITMADPNCAVAHEGPENYGSPCAAITCERAACGDVPGVD